MLGIRSKRASSACALEQLINFGQKHLSTSNISFDQQIVVPKRIHRSNTDILAALSETVKKDYTGFHYKYHDDPYMLPRNNLEKRSFALAKESGRNSARYFLNKYPELFYRDDAEPKVEAFSCKDVYDKSMTFTQNDLQIAIDKREVTNAVIAFEKLREQGEQMPQELVLKVFQLICFYNEHDVYHAELTEENWFKRDLSVRNNWQDGKLADQLFQEIEKSIPSVISVYIQALIKHFHVSRAYELYMKTRNENKPLTLGAYNSLLEIVPYTRESAQSRHEFMVELLEQIANAGLHPTLTTFNRSFAVISRSPHWKFAKNEAKKLLNEMRELHIKPSLAIYYHILRIFYAEKFETNDTLYKIMDVLKNQTLVYTEPDDLSFFEISMRICEENLQDINLALQIHRLFVKGENSKFVNGALGESHYYKKLFYILCKGARIEELMDYYTKYVPNVYIPEISVYLEIFRAIELYEAYEHLPYLWTDLVGFEYTRKDNLLLKFTNLIAKCEREDLQEAFSSIAKEIIERYHRSAANEKEAIYTDFQNVSKIYNNCIQVFERNNQFDHVIDVLKLMDENSALLEFKSNIHDVTLMCRVAQHLLTEGAFDKLVFVLNHTAKRNLLEIGEFVTKHVSSSSLNEHQINYVNNLIESYKSSK